MADIVSIEETNKIRKAIGLPPLPVPGAAPAGPTFKEHDSSGSSDDDEEPASTLQTREAAGYDNWQKLQDEKRAKKVREERLAAIKRAKDAAQRSAVLEGKGLGDVDDKGDLDTKAWLLGQKKRQKKLEKERAKKMEEELAERERLAAVEYSSKDLAGVRVAHELDAFDEEGGEQVLTLKDTTIDGNEEEGDELENINMREQEVVKERLELKKRRPVYDPNVTDESGERKILAQYDEEIDGKKRKRFTLDGMGATEEERQAKRQEIGERLRAQPISLDILRDEPKSDYMDISEIKIKKPKRDKKKKTRQKAADDQDIFPLNGDANGPGDPDAMEIEETAAKPKPKPKPIESSFVDDEDLQASLAAQRKAAFKKRKRQRPEDLARQLREEGSATPGEMDVDGEEEEPGLVIDETSEFVSNLQKPSIPEQKSRQSIQPSIERGDAGRSSSPEDVDGDVKMEQSYAGVEDEEELLSRIKRQASTDTPDAQTTTGLGEEETTSAGMGATLNLLKQRGIIKSAEMGDINALHRDRQRFLAEKQKREADAERKARLQREKDRASGKFDRMSQREKEAYAQQFNKQRDQEESRKMADAFNREYKPDVQLKYIDEYGRAMNQKEAFKSLSHDFHGKGSGKQKTEKKLKKLDEEKKRESTSLLDSSQATGMNNAMGATAKKNRQAGVRLG